MPETIVLGYVTKANKKVCYAFIALPVQDLLLSSINTESIQNAQELDC